MTKFTTQWKSEKPNPDEDQLKMLWQAEIKNLERSLAVEKETVKRHQANRLALLKPTGLSELDINRLLKEDAERSKKSLKEAEQLIAKPPIDFEALHKLDLELAQANSKRIEGHNPSWQGFIWNPSYNGFWWARNGEAEEDPSITFSGNRLDPRAQTWGEGWWDEDYSEIHGYLAFTFSPPSWGHLHISTYPWLHGYYSLYSDDEWYKGEYARAELDTWIDVHQNYWRSRQYIRRFTLAGSELHPERSGRVDAQYGQVFTTNVGENDTVTVRVGARLYGRAQASGGRSSLNFQAGSANYISIPYVYWYLHH